jgi:hypothetical protein
MLGAITTTTPATGTDPCVRLHTAKVGPLDGKSLTTQFGRSNETGTVDPYTYSGGKLTEWELSMESNGVLGCKLSLDVAKEDTRPRWPSRLLTRRRTSSCRSRMRTRASPSAAPRTTSTR